METKIGQYKGIEVTVKKVKHTEEDIMQQINYLMAINPDEEDADVVEEGSVTDINFKGMKDGVAFPGGTAEGYTLVIGSHSFIEGFEEKMIGMKKGETRNLDLKFPEVYHDASLAGQEVVFEVKVNEIKKSVPAQLTDEFAKKLAIPGVNSVDSLKGYIENMFIQTSAQRTQVLAADTVMDTLINSVQCNFSKEKLDEAFNNKIVMFEQQVAQQGMTMESYSKISGISLDDIAGRLSQEAVKQVRLEAALEKIIELENITATADEIDQQFAEMAHEYGMDMEMIKSQITEEQMARDVKLMKAGNLVVDTAVINFED